MYIQMNFNIVGGDHSQWMKFNKLSKCIFERLDLSHFALNLSFSLFKVPFRITQ